MRYDDAYCVINGREYDIEVDGDEGREEGSKERRSATKKMDGENTHLYRLPRLDDPTRHENLQKVGRDQAGSSEIRVEKIRKGSAYSLRQRAPRLPLWIAPNRHERDDSHSSHCSHRRCRQHNQHPHRCSQPSQRCRPDDGGNTSAVAMAATPANSDTFVVTSRSLSGEWESEG